MIAPIAYCATNAQAKMYEDLSYMQVLSEGLKVMDSTVR